MPSSKFASPPRRQRPPGPCHKTRPATIIIPPTPPPWPADITWQLHFEGTIFTFPADDNRAIVTPNTDDLFYEAQTVQPMTIGPQTYDATGHIKFTIHEETGTYDLIYDLVGRIGLNIIWIALHTDTGFYMQGPPFDYPEKLLPCLTQIGTLTISGS
jgi:hypothetical protein